MVHSSLVSQEKLTRDIYNISYDTFTVVVSFQLPEDATNHQNGEPRSSKRLERR